jgi:hypothetical protein
MLTTILTQQFLTKDDGLGSLTLANITAIKAAKVQLAIRVEAKRVKYIAKRVEGDLKELDIDDEEEHEEVQTLG